MSLVLTFLAIFLGILLLAAVLYFVAKWLYALSKWIEKKTGNSTLAYGWTPMVFLAPFWAAYGTWMVHLNPMHK